jgi:hypothetical protein
VPIVLQDRDIALLYFTWQSRYVTQRQYRLMLWPDATKAAVSKRLKELTEEKLLRTYSFPLPQHKLFYSITIGGLKALATKGFGKASPGAIPKAPSPSPALQRYHELVDLRIGIAKTGHLIDWTSEHELRIQKRWVRKLSTFAQAEFRFEAMGGEGKGLLEYEQMGPYRKKFMDALLRMVSSQQHRDGYLWFLVSRDARRAEQLRRWAVGVLSWRLTPNQIYFGHFEAIKAGGLAGGFVNLIGKELELPALVD